jgi:hypothetical protein
MQALKKLIVPKSKFEIVFACYSDFREEGLMFLAPGQLQFYESQRNVVTYQRSAFLLKINDIWPPESVARLEISCVYKAR